MRECPPYILPHSGTMDVCSFARIIMKSNIHPKYVESQVTCGCGNKFTTRATKPELKVDICSVCHPFYTGKLKFVDTAGRIEKFKNKFAGASYGTKK